MSSGQAIKPPDLTVCSPNFTPIVIYLYVRWDGKLMEDLASHEHVDSLPVLL